MAVMSVLLTSSVLILAVLLLRRVFRRKVDAVFIYALWLIVALRLLMPVPEIFLEKAVGIEMPQPGSSVSVMNLAVRLASHWGQDTDVQGEEQTAEETENLIGEDSIHKKQETEKSAAGQVQEKPQPGEELTGQLVEEAEQKEQKGISPVQIEQAEKKGRQKSEMSENTGELHMSEKTRGGGVAVLQIFPNPSGAYSGRHLVMWKPASAVYTDAY